MLPRPAIRRRHVIPLVILAATASSLAFATATLRDFLPPRTAVVDISEVFEGYQRKIDIETTLQAEAEKAQAELKDLEDRYTSTGEELKLLEEGSSAWNELVLKQTQLQLQIKNLQKSKLAEFQKKHLDAVTKIRDEIAHEIERYAGAHQLDLVLEKRFSAESRGAPAVKWPIVHFAKPEIDITEEIIRILNERAASPTPR